MFWHQFYADWAFRGVPTIAAPVEYVLPRHIRVAPNPYFALQDEDAIGYLRGKSCSFRNA